MNEIQKQNGSAFTGKCYTVEMAHKHREHLVNVKRPPYVQDIREPHF